MFRDITRNNRLFMLGNFLFALSYGLWMNLRPLHLGHLGATPAQVGTVLGIVALAGAILPLPAGMLTDRIGPRRVILGAWSAATLGTLIAALAPTWPVAGAGFAVFMLVIAANPATVSLVLLNTPEAEQEGQAERVMATVFASWPAAMVVAPALGGLVAGRAGITAALWCGVLGFMAAVATVARVAEVIPARTGSALDVRAILNNRRFRVLALYYPLVMVALYTGYALAPTYLEGVRQYSVGAIGALFSIFSLGSLLFNYVVGKTRPRVSFVVLLGAAWVGTLLVWRVETLAVTGLAFVLLGAISTVWLLAQASFGQLVSPQQRGLALGITETLGYVAIALASWMAGQLYEGSAAHDLPFIVAVAAMVPALAAWLLSPLGREAPEPHDRAADRPSWDAGRPAD